MNATKQEQRYLIASQPIDGAQCRISGSAFKEPNENFYRVFLRLLPGIQYYLVPHRDRTWEFILFSGAAKRFDGGVRFFCKIGSGISLPEKGVIEIHLPDLQQVYYLKLDPKHHLFNSKAA